MIIEQFVPAFHYGDAVGNSTWSFHRFLTEKGIDSRIIAMTIDKPLQDKATFFHLYRQNPTRDSIKILHFAVPSELTDFFLLTPGKKAMIYHNVTPPHFFMDFSTPLTLMTDEGRKHLERLSGCFDIAAADSTFNAGELKALNYWNVHVFPLLVDLDDYRAPHSAAFSNLIKKDRKNILFVGRISPNKKIEDLIKVLYCYKKYFSPTIRLIIAGNSQTLPGYFYALQDLVCRLDLTREDVVFTGHIPFEELLSLYKTADVFLSMSEHEGFCLPLIESCFFQLPAVAFDAGAVGETLGGAGILFHHKNHDEVAGLVEQVITNSGLRSKLQRLERERMEKYKQDAEPGKLLALIEGIES